MKNLLVKDALLPQSRERTPARPESLPNTQSQRCSSAGGILVASPGWWPDLDEG